MEIFTLSATLRRIDCSNSSHSFKLRPIRKGRERTRQHGGLDPGGQGQLRADALLFRRQDHDRAAHSGHIAVDDAGHDRKAHVFRIGRDRRSAEEPAEYRTQAVDRQRAGGLLLRQRSTQDAARDGRGVTQRFRGGDEVDDADRQDRVKSKNRREGQEPRKRKEAALFQGAEIHVSEQQRRQVSSSWRRAALPLRR